MYISTISLLFVAALAVSATTKTVCASGCDYTSFQTALTATASDCAIDVLSLTSGETSSGSFAVPFRNCTGVVQVRSSRYLELPAVGTRVGPAHVGLMHTISASAADLPALKFYERPENDMTAVDTATDVMTIAVAIPSGVAFSCTNTPPPPLVAGVIYYSLLQTGTTMKASLTPGGAAIDITGAGGVAETYYLRPHCIDVLPRKNWRFTGLKITTPSGTSMQSALVRIGGLESNPLSVPRNIWFDRNLVQGHGDMAANWPSGGIEIRGGGITVSDSYFSDIRVFSGEGKPLLLGNVVGPVLIENNYIGGGSIGLLVGGSRPSIPEQQSKDITVRRNHFAKPGKEMYREGAGAPTGSCYYGAGSGMYYLNTSSSGTTCSLSGRCYSCQSNNTWAIDTTAAYRADDFLTKNPIELKEGDGVAVEGNIFEGQQASIDGQGNCILGVVGATAIPTNYLRDITIRDNRCIDTWGGIAMSSYPTMTSASRNVSVENNLVTGMASPRLLAANGGTGDVVWQMRVPKWQGVTMRHNTHRHDAAQVASTAQGLHVEDNIAGLPAYSLPAAYIDDNIWWGGTAGTRTASGGTTCNSTAIDWGTVFLNDGSKQVRNNVHYGTAGVGGLGTCATTQNLAVPASDAAVGFASDHSLLSTSAYSAACASGCAFAATDGADVGVDLLRLNTAISGVTAGTAGFRVRMAPGSVGAIAHYTSPDASACTVKLYTNLSRLTLHGDTDIAGEQLDSRAGSVTAGTSRQLVLGNFTALTASTTYQLTATCGASVALASFRTLPAGPGTYIVVTNYPAAIAGEYSSSADMSTPTVISSSTMHVVPVPTGTVRYHRATGGAIAAHIAP